MRGEDGLLIALALVALAAGSGGGGGKRLPRPVHWSDSEMRAYIELFTPVLGNHLEPYLAMMAAESGLDPQASSGSAWGLNQAQGPLLRAAGWRATPAAFGGLNVIGQLPFVARMLKVQIGGIGYVPITGAEFWRMNLSPKAAKERADVIYTRERDPRAYAGNKGLDQGKKGFINMADLQTVFDRVSGTPLVQRHWAQLRRLQSAPKEA